MGGSIEYLLRGFFSGDGRGTVVSMATESGSPLGCAPGTGRTPFTFQPSL